MRPELARTLLALAGFIRPTPCPRTMAIDTVLLACKIAAASRPQWWRWTVWLAGGITCRRIEAA